MPVEVILPKVDMDMETGRISRWYARDGEAVTKGQLLFEIETDKAAMEIDAPATGTLRDVSAAEGVSVPVGKAVAWIFAEGEEYKAPSSPLAGEVSEERTEGGGKGSALRLPVDAHPAPPPPGPTGHPPRKGEGEVRATPLARRLAAEAGLQLSDIPGSGPKGRTTRKDVEAHIAALASLSNSTATQSRTDAAPTPPSPREQRTDKGEGRFTATETPPLHAVWLREGSDVSAIPLVLLHGFGADLNSWRPLFAGVRIQNPVLAIDLPGHGRSPRDIPATLYDIAESVEQTLLANRIGPFVLAAHSFGGAVAATLAARGNVDIHALALIAPAGLGPQINGAFLDGFVRARSEASLMPWLKLLAADKSVLTRPFINATLSHSADEELRAAQKTIIDRYFPDGTQVFDIRPALASLRIPTRVIFGAADRIIPASQAAGLPGEIATHIFPATGHMPQIERREEVLRIIQELARAGG
ncbi:acetoin dehydrogenase dihydrolipoyllysine-residue acetyltransferase subunit [Brucella sp. IR073]|uniref:acetoin dehydrogenase dihydrolipoyllysine-residue acetyltransferase subunit n=1 Tax=unclassified Brucella TaxID=2632610 RepID=UPI003B981175